MGEKPTFDLNRIRWFGVRADKIIRVVTTVSQWAPVYNRLSLAKYGSENLIVQSSGVMQNTLENLLGHTTSLSYTPPM